MPHENVPYTDAALSMARCYYMAGQYQQGDAIANDLLLRSDEWLSWIQTIRPKRRNGSRYSQYVWLQTMERALTVAAQYNRTELFYQYSKSYEQYVKQYPKD